jgi:hypothetical protein
MLLSAFVRLETYQSGHIIRCEVICLLVANSVRDIPWDAPDDDIRAKPIFLNLFLAREKNNQN